MATRTRTNVASNGAGKGEVCPYCGQPLLNQTAVHQLHASEQKREHELQTAAERLAKKLADDRATELERKHTKELAKVKAQLETRADELSELKAKHRQELKSREIKLRADAETTAARKAREDVRTELGKKDRLLKRFEKQIAVQERQIQDLTADERGDFNEEQLLLGLRAAFPDDTIERVGHGRAGGDIVHEVRVRSESGLESAGRIVYECKDTQNWSDSFIKQARKEGETHDTPYLVIISRAFPSEQKTLFVKDGVAVVDPARSVDLARIMRRMVVEVHRAELTADGQEAKGAELCAYLGSAEFRRTFDTVAGSGDELAGLLAKERTWHEHSWARRQSIYTEIGSKTAAIDARIQTIVQKRSRSKKAKVVTLHKAS